VGFISVLNTSINNIYPSQRQSSPKKGRSIFWSCSSKSQCSIPARL